jgi:RNA-directed DNA polymerase
MPAELVLRSPSELSNPSRRPESTSAFHPVIPASDEACRVDEPSRAHPAPTPRRHGAYERWLLGRDSQRGGGDGQSVEWFFDSVSHEWLIKFLEHRIGDERVLRLIHKWLKVGVMEQGELTVSEQGTPQGAVASPLLANAYLHYVFDLWAERWRKRHSQGELIIVRYADDIVCGFEYEHEAKQFMEELRERLKQFALSLNPDKTRLIEFGRHAARRRARRGLGKPETFNFLGFTHICGQSRRGHFLLKRKTRRDRMRTTLQALKSELRQCMHQPLHEQGTWLGQVVRGYFAYHAIPTNADRLGAFRHDVVALWRRALRRRSQNDGTTWSRIERLSAEFIPMPRILHPWPDRRFLVKHPRWEPSARIGPARFCAGGA